MYDFNVWDIFNPPSLTDLKLLSKRHPYQPISELLRKEVDSCKNLIHTQIESITQYRYVNSECREDFQENDCCSRYCYPSSEGYSRLENNISFNVLGGRKCEPSLCSDFKISINELMAFLINSEAKFTKVYREGISNCFLMPSEFSDDTMRNSFRIKFEQFVNSSRGVTMEHNNYRASILSVQKSIVHENVDFPIEHSKRREAELEYYRGRCNGVVDDEESDIQVEISSKGELPPATIDLSTKEMDDRGINSPIFNCEFEKAQKQVVDARQVCLTD